MLRPSRSAAQQAGGNNLKILEQVINSWKLMSLSWIQKPVRNPGKGLFLSPVCCVLRVVEGSARYKVMHLTAFYKHYTYHTGKKEIYDMTCAFCYRETLEALWCVRTKLQVLFHSTILTVNHHSYPMSTPKFPTFCLGLIVYQETWSEYFAIISYFLYAHLFLFVQSVCGFVCISCMGQLSVQTPNTWGLKCVNKKVKCGRIIKSLYKRGATKKKLTRHFVTFLDLHVGKNEEIKIMKTLRCRNEKQI